MKWPALLAPFVALLLLGSLSVTYPTGSADATGAYVEVRLGKLATGSSVTTDHAEGTASVAGSLLSVSTDLLYLNNTNATGAWYVKLASVGTSGLANVVSLTVGIDNGTAEMGHVLGAAGALTQSAGSYMRLEPGSTNRIYLTQVVGSLLAPDTTLTLDIHASDDATGAAYLITNANLTIT